MKGLKPYFSFVYLAGWHVYMTAGRYPLKYEFGELCSLEYKKKIILPILLVLSLISALSFLARWCRHYERQERKIHVYHNLVIFHLMEEHKVDQNIVVLKVEVVDLLAMTQK